MKKNYYAVILAVLFLQIIGCQKDNSITSPTWDLSGKIVFNPVFIPNSNGGSLSGIYMLDLNSEALPLIPVVANGDEPRVNPAGTTIVYDAISPHGTGDIYTINLAGGVPNNLKNDNSRGDDSWPDWSPDGNSIVFNRVYYPTPKEALCVMNRDGSNLHALTDTTSVAVAFMPRWSPDGSKIAFVGRVELDPIGEFIYNLYTISKEGSNQQVLDQNTYVMPRWSPDSKKIAYGKSYKYSSDTTGGGVFIVDVDSKLIQLMNRGLVLYPYGYSWLSNNCLICVGRNLKDNNYQVYRVPIYSPEGNTLIAAGFKSFPTTFASPNGRFIGIFGQKGDDNKLCLYIVNSDGTNFRKLKDTGLNASIQQDYYSQWIK